MVMVGKGLVIAMLLLSPRALGGDLLRGGAAVAKRNPSAASDAATASATDALRSNAKDALSRTTGAINAIRAMQDAARETAKSGANNLGADPNHPGLTLPSVPDGLAQGGLQVDPAVITNRALWSGAYRASQSASNGKVTVNITQHQQQAVLNWRTFNVGKNTTVNFDQSAGGAQAGEWIAFNKVNDPSGSPTQILGSITAQGQVYIINQNGIIFGGTSQVNVHTLVASSLPINDNLLASGLLNNPDAQFLFSALALPAGSKGTPAFTPPVANTPDGRSGDVVVQPGAQLSAPSSADHVGGRVVLVGPNVRNSGTISTPDGQTILAAGLQVGFDAHSTNDATLRGLDVYIGAVGDGAHGEYGGTATNEGLIEVFRGNATMAGKSVRQMGGIDSSTSVSLNGRIDLLANYGAFSNTGYDSTLPDRGPLFVNTSTGTVTIGSGSAMQILPEWNSQETVTGTKLPLQSQVNVQGRTIYFGANSSLLAPNAKVTVSAGVWDYFDTNPGFKVTFVRSGGQIYLDSGAMINVAGSTDIAVAMAQYLISVELRGAELADSPVQRTGVLRGPTLTVDLRQTGTYNGKTWYGTPLADLSGYVGLIQRTAGQLTVDGGSVSLSAGESVVLQKGSIIDVSGGFSNYQGGFVQTTRVLQGGNLIDISKATPDQQYDGIYSGQFTTGSSRWGVTKTYNVPWMSGRHYEEGYVQGANGGSIDISAPAMALDGTMRGNTVAGPKQRSQQPAGSSLSLKFESQQTDHLTNYQPLSPTPPSIVFGNASPAPADPFQLDADGIAVPLRGDRKALVNLSPELFIESGFSSLTVVNSDGDISVPTGVELSAPAGGAISLSGRNISILGKITVPGGKLNFSVYRYSPYGVEDIRRAFGTDAFVPPVEDPARGMFTLGPDASLSAAGLVVDDRINAPAPLTLPLVTRGGSIKIDTYSADLASGSEIDVSGGVVVSADNRRTYGDAGSISILTGNDLNFLGMYGGKLNLGAILKGYSGAKGGTLTIEARLVQIGGSPLSADTLLLQPEFFSQGGFTQFNIQGFGAGTGVDGQYLPGVYIAPGTVIEPVATSLVAFTNVRGNDSVEMRQVVKPQAMRTPVSLTFGASEIRDEFNSGTAGLLARGDVVLDEGAVIRTDPMASVTLRGQTVAVLGSVYAPAGVITISGATNSTTVFNDMSKALTTVYIGPNSRLSAAGAVVHTLNQWGNNTGYVLPGGTINVTGNIVASAGAVLDVSGTSAVVDVPPAYLNLDATLESMLDSNRIVPLTSGLTTPLYQSLVVPTRIDSDGGTITLKGGQMLFSDATLIGKAGGPTANGGTLNISSGRFYPDGGAPATPVDVTLTVTQSGITIPVPLPANQSAIGMPVTDSAGNVIQGQGWFAADTFVRGGFDSLSLGGVVQFSGPVTINARQKLAVADGGVIYADAAVNLSAPYVKLGQSFHVPYQSEEQVLPFSDAAGPYYFTPTYGTGSLNVRADIIDIGNLSLQGIGTANLYAKNDIRGDGTFNMAGNLFLQAGQIYPATSTVFNITAYDYAVNGVTQPGSVTIASSGVQRDVPLSAGGRLNIFASVITQGGVLRAPMGSINLGWDGTGTAPVNPIAGPTPAQAMPVTQQITLQAGSITSVSAVNSLTGEESIIPYGIVQNGTNWIDPTGRDITAGGVTGKSISLSALGVTTDAGSLIDISGGGDLMAYTWVRGNGGSTDILASSSSFAVIPGYDSNFSPYGAFNSSSFGSAFSGDPGYVNDSLQVGDRVFLGGSGALAAGVYTLLPARYALLPGAVLVTPQSGQPIGTFQNPDGSYYVSGYRFNDLNSSRSVESLYSRFEVASASVFNQRAQYETWFASSFLQSSALKFDSPVPRLPQDGGYLLFSSTQAMSLQGDVRAQGAAGGRGGLIDISTPIDIVISGSGASGQTGKLVLDSSLVSRWGAESLLIGGSRTFGTSGTTVKVATSNITVDNAGSPLTGPEIILAATRTLTLAPGAQIEQSGLLGGAGDLLYFGDPAVAGSGNGTMLRVSSDATAQIYRYSVTVPADFPQEIVPKMTIGAGASITGNAIILDSTYATSLDSAASILGNSISLDSGRITIQLDNPGTTPNTVGLVLAGSVLQGLQSAQSLSLLSYTSIDVYGSGQFGTSGSLAFHAGAIRGYNTGGGQVNFSASAITLDNSANAVVATAAGPLSGTLAFTANAIRLGQGTLKIDQYANLALTATGGIIAGGTGELISQGAVTATAPVITAEKSASHGITSGGALSLVNAGTAATVTGGLGASLTFKGTSISADSDILLPSGILAMQALTGDVIVRGRLDVGGTTQTFYDLVAYTDAGRVSLASDNGSVEVLGGAFINVAAQSEAGDAGSFSVSAPKGVFSLGGTIAGQGGASGVNGTFTLDTGSLASFATLTSALNGGGFTESRTIRVHTGDVVINGVTTARNFSLSTDGGSITVNGTIDASGVTGGTIDLRSSGSVTLSAGSILNASAKNFSNAGKGGAVYLEGGSEINGTIDGAAIVDIQTGSTINLAVASKTSASASFGQFTGTLHIRAPQVAASNELRINPINGSVLGASKIEVEGYKLFDITSSGGTISTAVQNSVKTNGTTFANATTAITNRILANNTGLAASLVLMPGAEIINRSGNLTLGTTTSTSTSDWNLATYRFGANNVPGVLTLKAAGDLVFYNALSDGFSTSAYTSALLAYNTLLPANAQSWSYRLTAGADFGAADFHSVQPLTSGLTSGSLLLGKNGGINAATSPGSGATTSSAVGNRFQVIRTGTGDIDISARLDVQLLNQFATIYTAGVQVTDPTLGGTFDTPRPNSGTGGTGSLGTRQENPNYPVQYTYAGGDVTIHAQRDIAHYTRDTAGNLIADSEKELPDNWLYRRGYVDPATGVFGTSRYNNSSVSDVASTTWWVDFSNFFEGVGALGGGDVTLVAGNNVTNVDAVVPTNARMAGKDGAGNAIAPNVSNLIELGGGDVTVSAGRDISGGVYYVERGTGSLTAGGSITTNSTRSPSPTILNNSAPLDSSTWLPTTLYLGKGSFDVSARGDVLMGPVVNAFLLPQGYSNTYWYKTYFNTYGSSDVVNITSLGGNVTMRESVTLPTAGNVGTSVPTLLAWIDTQLRYNSTSSNSANSSAFYQPWLRLVETNVTPFTTVAQLMPSTLNVTAFSGDLNLVGDLTLFPSPTGSLNLLAAGAINGLQPSGITSINGRNVTEWTSSRIVVSDANPASIPGVTTPYAYQVLVGTATSAVSTQSEFLNFIDQTFGETGSSTGNAAVIQVKQKLHAQDLLHATDTSPVHVYAGTGNISGLTLFSPKAAQIFAGGDISDIGLYVQNVRSDDVTVVASGRDIVAYNPSSSLRVKANAAGNVLTTGEVAESGDIQISGPGTLEVLAGRNLDLGVGPNNADGTGVGIVSVGNARNPYLPFTGADIIVGAGLGGAFGLGSGSWDFNQFINAFVNDSSASRYLAELSTPLTASAFALLSPEEQRRKALEVFFLVLRDSGRDHTSGGGNYDAGFQAISALFPTSTAWKGDISLTSREIKTRSGGGISMIIPGGKLSVGIDQGGNQALEQGILTEHGGSINIFANGNVDLGTSRIFTLRGGNIMIWSSTGDIAAGASSKTVQSAPPTRVIIDPQSGNVQTDLAGLATGGGIGVLTTVTGVPPGDVDLIAPVGVIDAGDAGIRSSGNLNIAATAVLNASNISVGGTSTGTPAAPVVSAPNIGGLAAASSAAGSSTSAAQDAARTASRPQAAAQPEQLPSIINVELLGYGGGDTADDETQKKKRSAEE